TMKLVNTSSGLAVLNLVARLEGGALETGAEERRLGNFMPGGARDVEFYIPFDFEGYVAAEYELESGVRIRDRFEIVRGSEKIPTLFMTAERIFLGGPAFKISAADA
ncbi:MAG: hypothetical protein LC689_23385, partial [Myxococcales bacterium]|nr:hypothetical protein [Myxococcales bacterium]